MVASSHAVLYFWGVVGCLAVAAACNHAWHHTRHQHLTSRLHRASARRRTPVDLGDEPPAVDDAASPF